MSRLAVLALVAFVLSLPLTAQISLYGTSTPSGFVGTLDTGGQIPVIGNANFGLRLAGHPNGIGAILGIGFAPASFPFGATTILVDLAGILIFGIPAGITDVPIPLPSDPGLVSLSAFAQFAVHDFNLPGGLGLTNGVQITLMPDRTPTRAYIPGQNFAGGPGLMTILDLSQPPPVFRATGSVGFNGTISDNFPTKIAVAEYSGMAYCLGNATANQFIRAFDVTSDPAGVVTHSLVGDIPTAGDVFSVVGTRDLEAMSAGPYIFATSGGSTVSLQVFDVSGAPFSLPTSAVQTITYTGAGGGAVGLDLSPAEDRLAVVIGADTYSAITIYNITLGAPQPLSLAANLTIGAFTGLYDPSDVHFSPDGHLLFVTGSNGAFAVVDTQPAIPTLIVANGAWPATGTNLWCHGSAIAVRNGSLVGIVGSEGTAASYHVIDLNTTSPSFGTVIENFTTNSSAASNGNISNHRMHGRQSIVVAIDGTGATNDCQWVDVIDLSQPAVSGYQSWRVKMPTHVTLTPSGLSAIPRDFDIF